MTGMQLLCALNELDDRDLLAAQACLQGCHPLQTMPGKQALPRRRISRALLVAAVVLALLVSGFTTAMAVSPSFRERVFRLLQIRQEQVIPPYTPEDTFAEDAMQAEPPVWLGNTVEMQAIHAPVACHAWDGLFLTCIDPVETRQGARYAASYAENGSFYPLASQRFDQSYTLYGQTVPVRLDWAAYADQAHLTWKAAGDFRFYHKTGVGSVEASLFLLERILPDEAGRSLSSYYPVLLNLQTGELTDLLAGTEAHTLSRLDNAALSPDGTKLLLGQITDAGYQLYYADLISHMLYDLDVLSGAHADACTFAGDGLTCWQETDGMVTGWRLDFATHTRTELFAHLPRANPEQAESAGIRFLRGFDSWNLEDYNYSGTCFALLTDQMGRVSVLDLADGESYPVMGFVWPAGAGCIPSPDGQKLLLQTGPDGGTVQSLTVLDFATKLCTTLHRDNQQNAGEYPVSWFDADTVLVQGVLTADELCADFYLYRFTSPVPGYAATARTPEAGT